MKDKYALLRLGKQLKITVIEDALPQVEIDGTIFNREGTEDTHGFYDWLRSKKNLIVGVSFFLFEDFQFLIKKFRDVSYLEAETTKMDNLLIRLYFSDERSYDPQKSDDQLFTGNYFYESDHGEFAMTFELPTDADEFLIGRAITTKLEQ